MAIKIAKSFRLSRFFHLGRFFYLGHVICLSLLIAPSIAEAAQYAMPEPLPVRQMNPAMLRYLDPLPESAWASQRTGWRVALNQHYSTIFLADTLPTANQYIADMELYVADIELRKRISGAGEFSANLTLLHPNAGVFDGFLRNYHDALSLPNGGRRMRPNNQFAYHYAPNSATDGWQGKSRWELGNIQLKFRHELTQSDAWATALLSSVQLPTGNQQRGWNHGGIDAALGFAADFQHNAWSLHGEAWRIHPFKRNDHGLRNRDYTRATVSLGLNAPLFSIPLQWLVQIQGGSSPYRSGVRELDQSPWLASFALRWHGKNQTWTVGFVENISQRSTQDFGLLLSTSVDFSD
ncbi:MAG: DUF3187 family protein [Mariprofundaceae bacterium]